VSPTPFLIRFECSTGELFAIAAKIKIGRARYMLKRRRSYVLSEICTEERKVEKQQEDTMLSNR
jgi:hypothetical protein